MKELTGHRTASESLKPKDEPWRSAMSGTMTLRFLLPRKPNSAAKQKKLDEVHYQLMKRITKSIDSKMVDQAFDERFEKWWKGFEPWERRQLTEADFVKKGKFDLEEWVARLREDFHSNLHTLLVGQLRGWVFYWATLPLEFDIVDEQFDIEHHVQAAKRVIERESFRVSLDNIFYVPRHALSLASNVNELEKEQLAMEEMSGPWRKRFEQMTAKKISKKRLGWYREMKKLLKEQEERGEQKNQTQASRTMRQKHKWTEKQRENFVRAFNKQESQDRNFG